MINVIDVTVNSHWLITTWTRPPIPHNLEKGAKQWETTEFTAPIKSPFWKTQSYAPYTHARTPVQWTNMFVSPKMIHVGNIISEPLSEIGVLTVNNYLSLLAWSRPTKICVPASRSRFHSVNFCILNTSTRNDNCLKSATSPRSICSSSSLLWVDGKVLTRSQYLLTIKGRPKK